MCSFTVTAELVVSFSELKAFNTRLYQLELRYLVTFLSSTIAVGVREVNVTSRVVHYSLYVVSALANDM